ARPSGRHLLLGVLEDGSVAATDAALEALTPVEDIGWEFGEWAKNEAQRASFLGSAAGALEGEIGSTTGQFLIRVLQRRSDTLVRWVLRAMTTPATTDVMSIVERGVRSPDPETKDQAIEALETIGARTVLSVLLPLLEPDTDRRRPGARETLRRLSEDFDPWLRALAIRCLATEIRDDLAHLASISAADQSDLVRQALPSFGPMPIEHLDTLNRMDRVLVLQRVPMFSGLDPEDLDLVAATMAEVQFEPRERIYSDGEPGDEMLVIVEGEAVVSKARNGSRDVIETYGPGDHVGELSLLRGGQRIADVDSGDPGLHGLVLSKADLLSILDERPSVAMGMLATLATRLAEQT
ncbi:MAG: cyclic nucleotide-binding domain-containing protein, partial [Acidimicrobiia bacterium]